MLKMWVASFEALGPIRLHVQRHRSHLEEFRWSVGKAEGATFTNLFPFLILVSVSILEEINGGDIHQAGFDFLLQNLGCTFAELFLLRGNHRCFHLVCEVNPLLTTSA